MAEKKGSPPLAETITPGLVTSSKLRNDQFIPLYNLLVSYHSSSQNYDAESLTTVKWCLQSSCSSLDATCPGLSCLLSAIHMGNPPKMFTGNQNWCSFRGSWLLSGSGSVADAWIDSGSPVIMSTIISVRIQILSTRCNRKKNVFSSCQDFRKQLLGTFCWADWTHSSTSHTAELMLILVH